MRGQILSVGGDALSIEYQMFSQILSVGGDALSIEYQMFSYIVESSRLFDFVILL